MQQRYYDPAGGRFLSSDPVGTNPRTGFNFSRYSYANDNPFRFLDPDGRYSCTGGTEFCKRIDDAVGRLRESRSGLKPGSKEDKRVANVLSFLGTNKQKDKGPTFTPGSFIASKDKIAEAHADGSVSVDTSHIDRAANPLDSAAQAVGHETQHVMDSVKGWPSDKPGFVTAEKSAYETTRSIAAGFGVDFTLQDINSAVDASVKLDMESLAPIPDKD